MLNADVGNAVRSHLLKLGLHQCPGGFNLRFHTRYFLHSFLCVSILNVVFVILGMKNVNPGVECSTCSEVLIFRANQYVRVALNIA